MVRKLTASPSNPNMIETVTLYKVMFLIEPACIESRLAILTSFTSYPLRATRPLGAKEPDRSGSYTRQRGGTGTASAVDIAPTVYSIPVLEGYVYGTMSHFGFPSAPCWYLFDLGPSNCVMGPQGFAGGRGVGVGSELGYQ